MEYLNGFSRKCTFLTETEYALCCEAVGIESLPGFQFGHEIAADREGLFAAVLGMVRRGLLLEGDNLTLNRELTEAFRAMKNARRVLLVYRELRRLTDPCRLLYGFGDTLVSVEPGRGAGAYIGVTVYAAGELGEWLADSGLLPPDGTATETPDTLKPETPEGEGVADFVLRTAWPEPGAAWDGPPPEEVLYCLDAREKAGGALSGRLYYLRQSLYDRLATGSAAGVRQRLFSPAALAEEVELLMRGGGPS